MHLSKCIELLVLHAELYEQNTSNDYINSEKDKRKLKDAKDLLNCRIENPPAIVELSKLVGIHEYKLKNGTNKKVFYKTFKKVEEINIMAIEKLLDEAIRIDKLA